MLEEVDWGSVTVLVTVVMAAIGVIVWAVRTEGRSRANEAASIRAQHTADRAITELSAFRERVGSEYVTVAMLGHFKDEITVELRRVADRFDRWMERDRKD